MAIRISGLASGFDTESIIKEAMKAEIARVDVVRQQKQILEWKREQYREANTKLLALRSSLLNLKLQGTFQAKTVTSSDAAVLTATAASSAVEGSFSIEVIRLARGASKESTPISSDYVHSGGDASFTLNGKAGSATITVENGDTIATVVAKINEQQTATGIRATYDSGLNKFYLFTSGSGIDAKIELEDTDGFLGSTLNVDLTMVQGVDAAIKFNGGQELNFSSNRFTFNNINFNLLKAGQTVDMNVSTNIDNAVEKIKDFVEKYNAAVGYIAEKLGEKRYRDFAPLGDEQKKEMKEKEIELWEEKAKSGLLRSDSTLFNLYSVIRNQTSATVADTGKYSSLSAIGITTAGWQDQGKLYLDEDKLRTALSLDPEGVMKLFTNSVEGTDQGIAVRLYDQVNASMKQITNTAGTVSAGVDNSSLGREIDGVNKRISSLEERLLEVENRYYRQFTAMEQAIQRMNAQSQWLAQQFSNPSGR